MSLKIIEGDLLDFPNGIRAIAHSCNCQNIMGGGIALQIKQRYPEAYKADTEMYKEENVSMGTFSRAIVENDTHKLIYNLYTQYNINANQRQVDYEVFYRALTNLKTDILAIEHISTAKIPLGLPYKISCGLAGGNWKIIYSMIEDVFEKSTIETYIIKHPKYANL